MSANSRSPHAPGYAVQVWAGREQDDAGRRVRPQPREGWAGRRPIPRHGVGHRHAAAVEGGVLGAREAVGLARDALRRRLPNQPAWLPRATWATGCLPIRGASDQSRRRPEAVAAEPDPARRLVGREDDGDRLPVALVLDRERGGSRASRAGARTRGRSRSTSTGAPSPCGCGRHAAVDHALRPRRLPGVLVAGQGRRRDAARGVAVRLVEQPARVAQAAWHCALRAAAISSGVGFADPGAAGAERPRRRSAIAAGRCPRTRRRWSA